MGIDKGDARLVAHVQLPGPSRGYYQEVGRAGRDREPAACVALYHRTEARTARGFIDRTHPGVAVLRRVWRALRQRADEVGILEMRPQELRQAVGRWAGPEDVVAAVEALARIGPRYRST